MADQQIKLSMMLNMIDNFTAPVKKAMGQTSAMTDKVTQNRQELTKLGNMNKDIEHFRKLKTGTKSTSEEMKAAEKKVEQLSQQLNAVAKPTRTMTAEFNRATAAAQKLKGQHQKQQAELQQVRDRLSQAGVSTKNLTEATRKIRTETARYNEELEQQQQKLAANAKQQQKMNDIRQRNSELKTSASVDAVGVGAAIYGVKKLVDAYGEVASAQGEIQSLGINTQGIAEITKQAKAYSSEWAGTTQAEFIRASYDIKSGVSSLSDAAVGEMTKIAALTAGATKSSVGEMTDLFATGYGIYRKQFGQFGTNVIEGWDKLSAEERDMKFGEYFSAGIASSVQAFKTDGKKLSAALTNLGAMATASNVPFAEQLSILGQLSATMPGSEAATKYKAFLSNVVKANDQLGMSFIDANGQLETMPVILSQLREKYGDTLEEFEKAEIKKAFGSDEALGFILQMYPALDQLQGNMTKVEQSLAGGMGTTTQMAEAILKGPAESMQLLSQRVNNATASVGKVFAPTLVFAAGVVGGFADFVGNLMEQFPLLSNVLAIAATSIIAFKVASIAARFAVATYSDATLFCKKAIDFFTLSTMRQNAALVVSKVQMVTSTASAWAMSAAQKSLAIGTKIMTAAQWAWNVALSANPIGLIIIAIAGLIALAATLVDDWSPVINFFTGLWDSVTASFSWAWEFIKTAFMFSPIGLLIQAWEPIRAFFSGLWDGIKSLFSEAWDYIYNVLMAPINELKNTLGSLWDSLTGTEATVNVNQHTQQTTEMIGSGGFTPAVIGVGTAPVVAQVGGIVPAANNSSKVENRYELGGIVIQASEGMSAQEVADAVDRKFTEKALQQEQRNRARLYD